MVNCMGRAKLENQADLAVPKGWLRTVVRRSRKPTVFQSIYLCRGGRQYTGMTDIKKIPA